LPDQHQVAALKGARCFDGDAGRADCDRTGDARCGVDDRADVFDDERTVVSISVAEAIGGSTADKGDRETQRQSDD
jgi:hypothetical protein